MCADGAPPRADGATDATASAGATLRLDKWLWYARFFKSRSLAAKLCAAGKLRLNHATVGKAHQLVREGDVLTFPQGRDIRVVRVRRLGERRGPASEARLLYDDLAPRAPGAPKEPAVAERGKGSGRPTKKERRALDRLQEDAPEDA